MCVFFFKKRKKGKKYIKKVGEHSSCKAQVGRRGGVFSLSLSLFFLKKSKVFEVVCVHWGWDGVTTRSRGGQVRAATLHPTDLPLSNKVYLLLKISLLVFFALLLVFGGRGSKAPLQGFFP